MGSRKRAGASSRSNSKHIRTQPQGSSFLLRTAMQVVLAQRKFFFSERQATGRSSRQDGAGRNARGAGGGNTTWVSPMASMGLFAAVAWNSRSRLGGPTTGSGASYVSGVFSAVHSAKAAENSQRFLWTCAAPLLRLCQNHGCRDARKKQTTHIFVAIWAQAFRPWYM